MGSPSFGVPGTSNNAPLPIPGNTNPTGTNSSVGFGSSFPNYPTFGTPYSSTGPSANLGPWSGTSGGLANLNSGFDLGTNWQSFADQLGKTYGKGTGQAIYNILSQGLFNPQDAAAILNAMAPSEARGLANVQDSFGAEGSRFGSAAALGIGDYQSQVNLNEQSTLAQMFMQSQAEQLGLLQGILPTLHQEKADSGWFSYLQDALGVAGSLGITPPQSLALSPSQFGSSPSNQPVPSTTSSVSTPSFGTAGGGTTPGDLSSSGMSAMDYYNISSSAGSSLGGASSSGTGALGMLGSFASFF